MTRARYMTRAWHMARARHRARAGHAVGIDQNFVYIEIDTHDLKNLHNICTPCFSTINEDVNCINEIS